MDNGEFIEVRNFLKMYSSVLHPEKKCKKWWQGSSIALVVSEKSAQKITINH